ncbi:aspartyl/asparaginyl beta-hydroxylase domain-containing protein [Sphingomonas sp.]|uniref:aspartyl/asparaginyl beta-hydroxylase domain-containing protein n=1 Tax=Sphingomonas sp. TaxID=28214 RepID=UPI0025EC0ACC|nr:aspartyl/asparaginyl beta-hydroxylase domain-containing protein [Sphingomonas sp.]
MSDPAQLARDADQAAAAGDLARAADLLAAAAEQDPANPALWLKLASLQRASGRPKHALASAERALALSPLDFTALLLRASLLERLAESNADAAYANALARRPADPLPPQLAQIVAHAEQRVAAWQDRREARMAADAATALAAASDEERARVVRFQTNILRRTRPFHSEPTDFHFSGLVSREFHPRRLFPWLAELEAATDAIADEIAAVMAAERAELVPYIQYEAHAPLAQWRPLNHNRDWTAIHLWQNGARVEANARHAPRTLALLERIGQPRIAGASPNAMFSLLAPHTVIPPHVGVSNARLVCHLPLVVPPGCWFRVGAETREWRRGEAFLFDDTIEHEAANPSDELRFVLIFDVWHPDLSAIERDAVTAIVGGEGAAAGL